MSTQVPIEEISAIPYVDRNAIQCRTVCATTFYTEGRWQMWFIHDGRLHPIQIIDLAEGVYFGDAAAGPHDFNLNALNLIAQHVCNADTQRPFAGIWDDLYNIAASIAKLDVVTTHRAEIGDQAARMVVTEVEYLAIQCRGIFDYIQKIIKAQWAKAYSAENGSPSKQNLPQSFGDMVLEDHGPRSASDIAFRYLIPEPLAAAYAKHAPFFANLKKMRDAIVHRAAQTPVIFMTDVGPCIESHLWPFNTMTIWRSDEVQANNVVPLKLALGAMIYRTLLAAEELIMAYAQVVRLGSPVCPKHRLYLRASSGLALATLLNDTVQRHMPPSE